MERPLPLHAIARLALGIASVLGAGGGVVVVAALVAGAHSLRGQPGAPHDFTVAGQQMTYPSVNVAALVTVALAGAAAIAVLRGGRAVTSQVLAARRVRRLGRQGETTPAGYVRFTDERPMAFCAGLLHPRVFVSDGALRALAADELRAVLAHEHHHCRRRDPLRVAVVGGMAEALFFLPAVAHVRDRYVALADLRADDAAVAACGGDRAPLANAMMIFDEAAGPAGAIGIAPERVDRLLGVPPALALGRSRVVAAVLTIAAACGLAWRAGHAASLQATLAPPLLSHRPCVVVFVCTQACLSALALMVCARLAPGRRRAVARRPR